MASPILIPCIYCGCRPAAPGEHTLPAALGRFPVFGRGKSFLCKASPRDGEKGCNELLTGPLYSRLFRRGALSMYRRRLHFAVGRSARRGSRSDGPSYESPKLLLDDWGVKAPVDVEQGGMRAGLALGIILETEDGSRLFWRVREKIATGAQLQADFAKLGVKDPHFIGFVDDVSGRIRRLVEAAFPDAKLSNKPMQVLGGGPLTTEMDWLVGDEEARAVAAIAFHTFLELTQDRGGEKQYALIRSAIMGRVRPWRVVGVCAPEKGQPYSIHDELPERRKHLLFFGPTPDGKFRCHMRLFAEDGAHTPWWEIVLRDGVPMASPKVFVALVYFRDGPRRRAGQVFDGEILALGGSLQALVLKSDAPRIWTPHNGG